MKLSYTLFLLLALAAAGAVGAQHLFYGFRNEAVATMLPNER